MVNIISLTINISFFITGQEPNHGFLSFFWQRSRKKHRQAWDPEGLHPRGQVLHGELRAVGRSFEEALGRALHSQPATSDAAAVSGGIFDGFRMVGFPPAFFTREKYVD